MPEGDAVRRTADRLHRALAGRVLTEWDVRWPRWATTDLRGATTTEVTSRGKHLLHRLDSGHSLHSHLRMEGSWQVRPKASTSPGSLRRPDLRVVLGVSDVWALGIRLGRVDVVSTSAEARLVGHLGPDPLGEWSAEEAVARLSASGAASVGEALLDQRLVAGLGTIWTSETLYGVGVSPWARPADAPIGELADRAAMLLRAAVQTARPGLRVYGRAGRPCGVCGTAIRAGRVGRPPEDRRLFYCPRCQRD